MSGTNGVRTIADRRNTRQDGIRTLDDIKGRCVIDDETGCWLWRGAFSRSTTHHVGPTTRVWLPVDLPRVVGAGRVTTAGKAAWVLAGNPLRDGDVVWRHVCHRVDCINPAHSKAGTRQAMHKEIAASDRLKGDPRRAAVNAINRASRLTPPDVVRQAEAMFGAKMLQKDVCAKLGIQQMTARLIRTGQHPHSTNRQRVVRGASVFNLGS